MKTSTPEIIAARNITSQAEAKLQGSPTFRSLHPATQSAILNDLKKIRDALEPSGGMPLNPMRTSDPYAFPLDTPEDFRRRLWAQRNQADMPNRNEPSDTDKTEISASGRKKAATETIAERAGALIDEIDFTSFVAGLVHGTFDAIVDSSIRQMEAFADLVSSVAKNTTQFTRDNITANQARDWLVEQFPQDLYLDLDGAEPKVRMVSRNEEEFQSSPGWLKEFGLEGEDLTDELIEEKLVPAARNRIGESRLQTLATMVLLGMNRIVVRDGQISARVRFRAAARDKAIVDYAVSQDPGRPKWGARGSSTYATHSTMISTVGVNAQTDASLKAELFGEVKINFASETLPLDRFADEAQMALLQRNARASSTSNRNVNANQPSAISEINPPVPPSNIQPVQPVQEQPGTVPPVNERE